MRFNYQTTCSNNLLKELSGRQKDVINRRFGLAGERETLETIGQSYGITRERVRQIEEDGLSKLREKLDNPVFVNVFKYFEKYLKDQGSLKREDLMLSQLGGEKFKNHVLFLLTLTDRFEKFNETDDLQASWGINKDSLALAQKAILVFASELEEKKRLLSLPSTILSSYIEISKNILKGPEGLYGLREWPEVNPRGVKDKAYIILKREKNPLHFGRISSLVNSSPMFKGSKSANLQTVHNELIKDQRFVLVGRGMYALKEWGYEPGVVRDVISAALAQSKIPLTKEEVVGKVLEQRRVKPTTILLNLQNKKYFVKNTEGKYIIREV